MNSWSAWVEHHLFRALGILVHDMATISAHSEPRESSCGFRTAAVLQMSCCFRLVSLILIDSVLLHCRNLAIASTFSVHGDWDAAQKYHAAATNALETWHEPGHPVLAGLLAYHADMCLYTDQVPRIGTSVWIGR